MARTRGGSDRPETSLDAAMRAPSTTAPDVVVLDFVEEDVKPKDIADPKNDLWLSTVDGRYSSPIIPVRVGIYAETFPVHKAILIKSEYFSKAIEGEFREADDQAIDLPEEDPDIFSFVVAWLYEEKFVPIKSMSMALVAEPDKGKGREGTEEVNSGTESAATDSSGGSDESARNRRRRRRREQRAWENDRRKQPGRHRPTCNCATCTFELGPPCWSCGALRAPPPPRHRYHPGGPPPQPVIIGPNGFPRPQPPRRNRDRRRGGRDEVVVLGEPAVEDRMNAEDMRTWSLAYSLSIDVYVCAERYLMQDFKAAIAAFIINSFEIAGVEAAVPAVLKSCKTLHSGVSPVDPLLKKVFARVGFLQARLGKNFPEETETFFSENPELAFLIMKAMVERQEVDRFDGLPPMEAPNRPDDFLIQGRRRRHDGPIMYD